MRKSVFMVQDCSVDCTLSSALLCSLVDPGANQAYLLGRESFGRGAEAARTARPSRRTAVTGSTFRRHGHVVVDLSRGRNEQTILALPSDNDLAVLPACERGREAVQPQICLGPFLAVATKTGRL